MSERNTVLEPADEILDLAGPNLRGGKVEGRLLCQGAMGRRKPSPHVFEVAFKKLEGETNQSRKANQPIRLLRLEAFGFLASGQSAGGNLEELGSPRRWKIEHYPEPLEGLVG
jgi:hypothetical protein